MARSGKSAQHGAISSTFRRRPNPLLHPAQEQGREDFGRERAVSDKKIAAGQKVRINDTLPDLHGHPFAGVSEKMRAMCGREYQVEAILKIKILDNYLVIDSFLFAPEWVTVVG